MTDSFIVLDFETTGLFSDYHEVLQVAVIDNCGSELMYALCRPDYVQSWTQAAAVHGITPERVKYEHSFRVLVPRLQKLIDKHKCIVAYNASFEISFLRKYGIDLAGVSIIDPMLMFAPIYGEWNAWHGNYKWQKLTTCARYYDICLENAHDALADVKATLGCYNCMLEKGVDIVEVA